MPTSNGEGGETLRAYWTIYREERYAPLEEDKKVESKYLTEEDLEY